MKVKVENDPSVSAIKDILRVYYDPKLYINEKKYKLEMIKNLHDLGYYDQNESIFDKPC